MIRTGAANTRTENSSPWWRHPDVGAGALAILALMVFSKGFFQQQPGYLIETLLMHVLIALTLTWWVRLMSRRFLFSMLASTFTIYGLGFISKAKETYLGSPLLPWDVLLAPQMMHLWRSYAEVSWILAGVITLVLLALILFRLERPNAPRPLIRAISGVVVLILVASGGYGTISPNGVHNIPWDQKLNYRQHGFLLGLLLNAKALWMLPPTASSAEADQQLAAYLDPKPIPSEKPDVVVVLAESYTDLHGLFGLEAEPCFSSYREAGEMTTPVFGGYTANVEFELLTGYPVSFFPSGTVPWEMYVRSGQPDALPNQFRQNGYETVAVHTFSKSFWNRDRVFPLLGFDRFVAEEEIKAASRTGTYLDDSVLYDSVKRMISKARDGRPVFVFAITMQTHGDYVSPGRYPRSAPLPEAVSAKLSPKERASLATYAAIVRDHEKATCEFVDWVKARKKETILVYFGDHLPALGNGLVPYQNLGIVSRNDPAFRYQDHRRLFTTPLFVWSNRSGFYDLPLAPSPTPVFALGAEIFAAASLPVPAHFRFAAEHAKSLRDLACCYVDNNGDRIDLVDSPLRVLYRHAWDRLIIKKGER